MASPLRRCVFREAPDYYRAQRAYTKRTDVEYVTFPAGRITGLQSADCIEMIEIHDGGGKIETRVRESCCTHGPPPLSRNHFLTKMIERPLVYREYFPGI